MRTPCLALGVLCTASTITTITITGVGEATASPLKKRLDAVRALVRAKPSGFKKHFDPSFLKAVPPDRMRAFLKDYFKKTGPVISVREVERKGAYYAEYRFYGKKGVFPVKLGISSKPPHLISTLWFGVASPRLRSLDEVVTALRRLPGKVSFALWDLGKKRPRPIKELNANSSLALGSTFKLYILGALIKEVSSGRLRWDQTIALKEQWKSWPSGMLHKWPEGAPVTLSTLASLMISISDNSATDHLLHFIGRRKVEAMMEEMGHRGDPRNKPFLSTREMFLLKTIGGAARLNKYVALSEKRRRRFVDQQIAKLPRSAFKDLDMSITTAVDKVEWFGTAADLCRTMSWIKTNTAEKKARRGRAVLAINKGLTWRKKHWKYVGYKGGSEPGVLNLTWLVKRRDGRWLTLSVGWNDTKRPLDEEKLIGVTQGLILLLEKI